MEVRLRVNTAKSIKTAYVVRARFGSWKAAKDAASFESGKFVVRSAADGRHAANNTEAEPVAYVKPGDAQRRDGGCR
ncbi:hypothetical protein XM50_05750 [Sphingomonas sp. Ag1]|nr:hypothetical protein XM50_05750 [Sphingomonas sp. Ag1]